MSGKTSKQSIRAELKNEILTVAERIADMIFSLPDTTLLVKNSEWTIGEMVAHLAITQKSFREVLHGAKSPYPGPTREIIAKKNAEFLKEFTQRDGKILAMLLLKNVKIFLNDIDDYQDDHTFLIHFGQLTLQEGLGYCLCHLLMHGSAIALTVDKPFPITNNDVKFIFPFIKKLTPKIYDKQKGGNLSISIAIEVKNAQRFAIVINKGEAIIKEKIPSHVDCCISLDSKTYFLVSAGVINQWSAFLKGKIIVKGPKPWLALQIKSLFPNP